MESERWVEFHETHHCYHIAGGSRGLDPPYVPAPPTTPPGRALVLFPIMSTLLAAGTTARRTKRRLLAPNLPSLSGGRWRPRFVIPLPRARRSRSPRADACCGRPTPPSGRNCRSFRSRICVRFRGGGSTLPLILFIATCLSTFWVGAADWRPQLIESPGEMWQVVTANWQQGLTYMGAVLAILLTHEMGHFLQTVRYRIPASYPLCIPVPFSLIGTMGAVISMDGMRANRKQIFDIGIAGPLAGLAVAAPILYIGVQAARSVGRAGAARYSTLQSGDRALDDRMDAPAVGRSRRLGFGVAAQSVLHGRLGRHADHRASTCCR